MFIPNNNNNPFQIIFSGIITEVGGLVISKFEEMHSLNYFDLAVVLNL